MVNKIYNLTLYHYKGQTLTKKILVYNGISDQHVLIFSTLFTAKRNLIENQRRICDKMDIRKNCQAIVAAQNVEMFVGLIDPSRVNMVKRKVYQQQNVDLINEWDEMCSKNKELNELQCKNRLEELNKILTSGDTSVEAWVKVSNTMQLKKKSRKWKPDLNMNAFILEFKELNVHGQNKQLLEKRDKLNDKVVNLMEVYIPMLEQGGPIHII